MKQVFKYLPQGKKAHRLVFESDRNEKNVTFGVVGNKKEVFTFTVRHFEDIVKFDFVTLSDDECKQIWEKEEQKASKGKKKKDNVPVVVAEVVHTCAEPPIHTCAEPPKITEELKKSIVDQHKKERKKRLTKDEKMIAEQQKQAIENNKKLLSEDAPQVAIFEANDNKKLYFRFKNLMFEKAKTGTIVYVYRVKRVQKVPNVPVYDEQHLLMDQFQLSVDSGAIWKKECENYYFQEFYRPYDNSNRIANREFDKKYASKIKEEIAKSRQRYIAESLDKNKKEKEVPVNQHAFEGKAIPQIEKKPAPYPKRNAN